jgi:cobalt/nickel transport system permease protein
MEATLKARQVQIREALDGRVVLIALVSSVGVTVLTPPGHWERLGGEALLVAAAHAAMRRSDTRGTAGYRWLLGRLALLLPFLLLMVASMPWMTVAPGLPSPLERAGLAAARAVISFGALSATLRAVETADLLSALARLRVPAIFVTLMALMLRYLGLLEGEAMRMMRARDLRGSSPTVRERARVAGCMVGSLFLRSFERSERLSVAMKSRGFTGLLPSPPPRPLSRRSAFGLAILLLAQALLVGAT